jgi:protein involved in polysaccharide export with SLBB domain
MAKQRGMSDAEIDAKAQELKGETGTTDAPMPIIEDIPEPGLDDVSMELVEGDGEEADIEQETQAQPGKRPLAYFGYDIFKRDPALFQASVFGAVDPDYNIGPGDEIIIMLWGETQFRQVLSVDREGFIFIPEVGQVFVNGLNMDLLESKMFKVLSQRYSSLVRSNGGNPTTFLDISLGNLRPLRILVVGEVAQPGAYRVSPSTTLFSSLYYFNGPTTLGSLRDVQLIRRGKQIATIDFYDFLLSGKKQTDVRLQLDDTIFLPPRGKTVSIQGEINRPAIYELTDDEGLIDIVNLAGDLKASAYLDRIQIDRIVPFSEREEVGLDRIIVDVDLNNVLNKNQLIELKDGDQIQIFPILDDRLNTVTITGNSVVRPGVYDLGEVTTIFDLIIAADSLLGDVYLDRLDLIRVKEDLTEELIKVNLEGVLENDPKQNLELEPLDRVRIYSLTEMNPQKSVSIGGFVINPGTYSLYENMNIHDLLFLGGGFLDPTRIDQTFLGRADLIRFDEDRITRTIVPFNLGEILDHAESTQNLQLLPGDEIRVYSQRVFNAEKPISITGVVKNPGQFTLKTGMSLKDLILEAGGLSETVYKYRIDIARIDPLEMNKNQYAETITLEMDETFSVSNIEYESIENPGEITQPRNGFKLQPYDYISVRPDPYFSMQKIITVNGAVYYPGDYTILSPVETISSVIERAGGLRPNAYADASMLVREGQNINLSISDAIEKPYSKHDFVVLAGDIISINVHPNIVAVFGEVNNPGLFKYLPGLSMRDYIRKAGGFTSDVDRRDVWIRYASGEGEKFKRYSLFSPPVKDGAVITVDREVREEVDKTELAKEITSILASMAQVIAIIILAQPG